MNQKIIQDFIGLIKYALGNKHIKFEEVKWEKIFQLAFSHHVEVIIYEATASMSEEEIPKGLTKKKIEEILYPFILKDANQISGVESLIKEFDEQNLSVIMLKGWVMKELYPRTDYRYSADTDIFIHVEDEKAIHNIIMSHEFSCNGIGEKKDTVYFKQFNTIEIHKNLFMYEESWNSVFNDPDSHMCIWKRLEKLDGYSNIYVMDADLFYVYHLAHMVKHLINGGGGIGVKAILDLWVYRTANSEKMDFKRINFDLDILGLTEFADTAWKLAISWFANDNIVYPNNTIKQFGDFIVSCGAYGHSENYVMNSEALYNAKRPNRVGYIVRRAFPSKKSMEKRFPVIKEHPVSLPFYWIKRLWRDGFRRKKEVIGEVDSAWNVNYEKVERLHRLYREWGVPRVE